MHHLLRVVYESEKTRVDQSFGGGLSTHGVDESRDPTVYDA